MSGVVMLLTGPLQSWGGPAPGVYERPTDAMPSLSALVGIIANALGRCRHDPIDDLADGATLAVRADRPGTVLNDFHTVGTAGRYALAADTGKQLRNPVVTNRMYLSDAAFLAVYEPPDGGISADDVFSALLQPARPLYFGRRSCVPAERIPVCVTSESPETVLRQAKLLRNPEARQTIASARNDLDYFRAASSSASGSSEEIIDIPMEASAPAGTNSLSAFIRQDMPKTVDPRRLYHSDRYVIKKSLELPASACAGRGQPGVERLYESLGVAP